MSGACTSRLGRTANQMRCAPWGTLFVWGHRRKRYAIRMALWLNRGDIEFLTPDRVTELFEAGSMEIKSQIIVVDHAAILSVEVLDLIDEYNAKVKAMMGMTT